MKKIDKQAYIITLANSIMAFANIYDTYEFNDNYSDDEEVINELHHIIDDLERGEVKPYKEYFQEYIDEYGDSSEPYAMEMANTARLLHRQIGRVA